jgi:MAP3K TRAFs-binding domain
VLAASQDDGKPVGWLWREFEDGQRWRALAVQARVFHADKTKNATLNPATTEVYETWWPEHTPAWAARYARDKSLAAEEYREVEELWRASKRALESHRTRLEREAQAAKKEAEKAQQLAEQKAAMARADFKTMREALQRVRTMQGEMVDPSVVQRLAFATYKAQDPDAKTALLESKAILRQLDPETSTDSETVGLWAAIHKRIYAMMDLPQKDRVDALSVAIWAHEKGFYLKNDYYNGINLAFLLDCRAAELGGEDAIVDRVQARRARERVVGICKRLLSEGVKGASEERRREEEYWIRATLVEALFGLGDVAKSEAEFAAAKQGHPETWMIATTEEQLTKLRALQ